MKRYFITCTLLCAQFLINAQIPQQMIVADSIFANCNYAHAALEYERCYFTSNNLNFKSLALLKRANCFKQQNDFENALLTLKRINLRKSDDSIKFVVNYEMALTSYLSGNFVEADFYIQNIEQQDFKQKNYEIILPLKILILNELQKYDSAKVTIYKWIDKCIDNEKLADSLRTIIEIAYNKPPKLKKENKAKILSTLLPGSGLVYAGYPGMGIGNFCLQTASLGLAVISFISGYYITGYFTGFNLFQKFYFGGIKESMLRVKTHNYLNTREFNNKVKEIVLGNN